MPIKIVGLERTSNYLKDMQSIDSLFVHVPQTQSCDALLRNQRRCDTLSDIDVDGGKTILRTSADESSSKTFANELTDADRAEILRLHNATRAKYGLSPVVWSDSLAQLAAQWADKRYFGHWDDRGGKTRAALGADYIQKPRLEGGRKAGESLAVWTNRPPRGMLPGAYGTQLWIDEEPFFDCSTGRCNNKGVCGHYTQMVHEPVSKVGCALRTFENGVDPRSWPSNVAGYRNVQLFVCQYDRIQTAGRPFSGSRCPR
jgi:hypothetical protein